MKLFYSILLYIVSLICICVVIYLVYHMVLQMALDPAIGLDSLVYGTIFIVIYLGILFFLLFSFKHIIETSDTKEFD